MTADNQNYGLILNQSQEKNTSSSTLNNPLQLANQQSYNNNNNVL